MFGFFSRKKEVEQVKEDTRKGFDSVKKDIDSIGVWIKHLDSEKNNHKKEIEEVKDILSTIKEDLEEVKNLVVLTDSIKFKQTPKQVLKKQTGVYDVQTGVQTGVQTPNLEIFSSSERTIIWVLINTDMNLSYDDIAKITNKQKSTIRGQINSIKKKADIIREKIETNGKKRVFIPEKIKEKMLKKRKVRVNK